MNAGITGYIYPQTGCSFDLLWFNTNNNWSGSFKLITSDNTYSINFISGKIFDDENFVYSIGQPQSNINISGNFGNNFYNYFLNDIFIYSKTGNFKNLSGFSLNWSSGHDWDAKENLPNIVFYGEKPKLDYIYNQTGLYTDPILIKVSGNINNNGPIEIYSGEIGMYSEVYRDQMSPYFSISGVENWQSGIKLSNGEVFDVYINQLERLQDINISLPLVLHTNVGILGKYLGMIRYREIPIQNVELSIKNSVSQSLGQNLLQSLHSFDITFINTENNTRNMTVIISGYEGNNIIINGYQDSFSGSWLGVVDNENIIPFNTALNIISGNVPIFPNVFSQNKKITLTKLLQSPFRDFGFTGSAIYMISGNNFYKTGIIGSAQNIFREYYAYNI